MTVSRVINNNDSVNPELATRVRAAVRELAFEPNEVAQHLRLGSEQATVGLVIEDLANPFYSRLTKSVEEAARRRGVLLITASSEEDPDREREVILELCRRRVAGLIVVPASGPHGYLATQMELGTPTVLVDRRLADVEADTVLIDNVGGAKAGTEHLLAKGHTSIAVLGFTAETYTIAERLRGVEEALAEYGLALDPELVHLGELEEEFAASALRELLDRQEPPTAVFCCNNRMTVGAVQEAARRGADIDIVGFDDVAFAEFLPMPVTLVTYDIDRLAREAADLLFARIDGGPADAPRSTTIETTLVSRGNPRR